MIDWEYGELVFTSKNCLVALVHSLFGRFIVLRSDNSENALYYTPNIEGIKDFRTGDFHAPVLRMKSIDQYRSIHNWLVPVLTNRMITLTEEDLWSFLCTVNGTYALVAIHVGQYAGIYRLELAAA